MANDFNLCQPVVGGVVPAALLVVVAVEGWEGARAVQYERKVARVLRAQAAAAPMSPELAAELEAKRKRATEARYGVRAGGR